MIQNIHIVSSMVIILSILSTAQGKQCALKRTRILNNYYTMETVRTFPDADVSRPYSVSFDHRGHIQYILLQALYRVNLKSDIDTLIENRNQPIRNPHMFVNSQTGLVLKNEDNQKVATLNVSSDDRFVFRMQNDIVLVIRLPIDSTEAYGKLYALNRKDATIIGQFVVTEWIKELGDMVYDIDIDKSSGDIVALTKNSDGYAIISLQKNLIDPCPEEDCQEKNELLKNALKDKLVDMEDLLLEAYKGNLAKGQGCEDFEEKLQELQTSNEHLRRTLEKMQEMDIEFKEELTDSIVYENAPNIPIRSKRQGNERNARVCAPKKVYLKQRSLLHEAMAVLKHFDAIIQGMKRSSTNAVGNYSMSIKVRVEAGDKHNFTKNRT